MTGKNDLLSPESEILEQQSVKKLAGERSLSSRPLPRKLDLLHDPALNKGRAFSEAERVALGLRGLLPPRIISIEDQADRVIETVRAKKNDLDRYNSLIGLQDR